MPNVVYVPRDTSIGSVPPNPHTTRGWEAAIDDETHPSKSPLMDNEARFIENSSSPALM